MRPRRYPSWHRGPSALRRPQVQLDNITLVPAHLLPRKAEYQALANELPRGDIRVVLPPADSRERPTMERVAQLFRAKGRHVTVLTEERLASAESRWPTPGHITRRLAPWLRFLHLPAR